MLLAHPVSDLVTILFPLNEMHLELITIYVIPSSSCYIALLCFTGVHSQYRRQCFQRVHVAGEQTISQYNFIQNKNTLE